MQKGEILVVREWDADMFHRRVLELEAEGYIACTETYSVTPEMNPETGEITHLRSMELRKIASIKD